MENCAVCGVLAKQKCAGCNAVFYCSREHQVIDWKSGHKKNCKCYEIESNDILGRYMIAKRDIKPGEVILRESPHVLGPKMNSFVTCLGCNKSLLPSSSEFYKCSKCTWPMCGKNCENSQYHVDECRIMAAKGFKSNIRNVGQPKAESSYCIIVPLRVIILREKNPKLYQEIMKLMSHYEQRISTKLYDILRINLVPFIKDFLKIPDINEKEILTIAGILDTNCFEIFLASKKARARGIYVISSMMAHECAPNTKHFVDDKYDLKLIATIPIKRGQPILTSYAHPLKTTIERRIAIKQAKCFDCVCPRCKDSTEMSTFSSSIKCNMCDDGMLTSIDPLENLSDWQCTKCDQQMPGMKVFQVLNGMRLKLDNLNKKCVKECERFLKENEKILPDGSVFIVDVKYALCLLYGNVDGYLFQDLSSTQLDRKIQLCQEMIKFLSIFEPGISNSVLNSQFELEAANIIKIKRQCKAKDEENKSIAEHMERLCKLYDALIAGNEAKSIIDNRFKRIKEQISM